MEQGQAGSHADKVIEVVSAQCPHLAFLLWGAHAQSKQKLIDAQLHLVLKWRTLRRYQPAVEFTTMAISVAPISG